MARTRLAAAVGIAVGALVLPTAVASPAAAATEEVCGARANDTHAELAECVTPEGVRRHLDAFQYVNRENFHSTIHAVEAFGLPSIWEALQECNADRLGHGVRIVDDITFDAAGEPVLGRLAAYVRDKRIPLEMCPSSNVQTGAAASIAEHPIGLLRKLSFRVTVNTDNRLMSGTSMSREMQLLVDEAGWTLDDLRWATINAMKSAFIPFDERLTIIEAVVKPGYAALSAAT